MQRKAFEGKKGSQANIAIGRSWKFAFFDFIYPNFNSVFKRKYGTLIEWSEFQLLNFTHSTQMPQTTD